MKKLLLVSLVLFAMFATTSCEETEETYSNIQGSWKLVFINDSGSYRKPNPPASVCPKCYIITFLKNNSMMGKASAGNFAAVYNLKKNGKIVFSAFQTSSGTRASDDDIIFQNNILMTERYSISGDTLKFTAKDKTLMTLCRN